LKLLLIGDSFSADWSTKYTEYLGWPNLLSLDYQVTNLSQAGIGEYKIYKQLLSVVNIESYDLILIAHASPWRIPTVNNPVHENDLLLSNSDLIFSDIEYHSKKITNLFNKPIQSAYNFYKYHYDEEFFKLSYNLLREKINNSLLDRPFLILNFRKPTHVLESTVLNFYDIVSVHAGKINHLSKLGNKLVYDRIQKEIVNV